MRVQHQLDILEVPLPLFVFVEELKNIYFDVPDGAIDMSVLAILLFVGTMVLSLWATMRVRQVYGKFSQLPASSGASGAETAATILREEVDAESDQYVNGKTQLKRPHTYETRIKINGTEGNHDLGNNRFY